MTLVDLRPSDQITSRPDNSTGIVGEEGIPVRQDLDGTQIQRLGIAGADADWGPDEVTIDPDGDVAIATPDGVGGTRSSSGLVRSLDDRNCSVVYVWTNGDDVPQSVQEAEDSDSAVVERPPGIQDDTENVVERVFTKGDDARVFVENEDPDNSNQIQYTLNFH